MINVRAEIEKQSKRRKERMRERGREQEGSGIDFVIQTKKRGNKENTNKQCRW